ncbi:heat shock protein Hsp-16.1/Hsp-16.11-like isoform X2 [Varroa jacobsoni]|uniref:SHSP domain-containing protein n=1 Tax=Varroa destructor TaxID=109461 RepID=A0A7M7KBU8_VARDE|nr:heat shock protein Hsp-16.1/Hsp-16.11-like isoform X2 [Varroa destructor]XP_022707365.1 heat shock protein Hsp-16.1/Hsp-16.11-like isoform X2 [Varroa jacobsoni]
MSRFREFQMGDFPHHDEFLVPMDVFGSSFDEYRQRVRRQIDDIMQSAMHRPERDLRRQLSGIFNRYSRTFQDDMFNDIFKELEFPSDSFQKVAREVKAEVDEKNCLLVELDMHEFEPEKITVKAVENQLIVHAKTQTPTCCKEFRREIQLPDGIDLDTVTSNLSPEGKLSIHAQMPVGQQPQMSRQSQPQRVSHGRTELQTAPIASNNTVEAEPTEVHKSEVCFNVGPAPTH